MTSALAINLPALTFSEDGIAKLSAPNAIAGLTLKQNADSVVINVTQASKDVLHIIHSRKSPPVSITLAANAALQIIESFNEDIATDTTAKTVCVINENAQLNYTRIQNQSAGIHQAASFFTQKRDSRLDAVFLDLGASQARHDLHIDLPDEHTESHFFGLTVGNQSQRIENHTFVNHQKPNCNSEQIFKAILNDQARGVFTGRIDVLKEAQQTDARQTNKTLLLSKGARIETTPQLNIHADDVKCSHGAAVGQLNPEEIFYFESRAIPRSTAMQMLTLGFAEDILMHQTNPVILNHLQAVLTQKLARLSPAAEAK